MFRRKLLVIPIIVAVLFAAVVGGVTLAQDGGTEEPAEKSATESTVKQRVAELLDVTTEELEDAFKQAVSEAKAAKMDKFFQGLVDKGLLDADQAQEYKDWLAAKPEGLDTPYFGGKKFGLDGPGFHGFGSGHGFDGLKFRFRFKEHFFDKGDSFFFPSLETSPELSSS